jgi:acyl carrier protein
MTRDELHATVVKVLIEVAPDVEPGDVRGETQLREDLDLDSLDFLDLVAGVAEATGLEIPERDYGKLGTLDAFVDYLDENRSATR